MFKIPPAWRSCDLCESAYISVGVRRKNEKINCVSFQDYSRVSLECVKEDCWEVLHQHCRMIEILLLPPEAVGARSAAASASLRGLVSTRTPGTSIGTKNLRLTVDDVAFFGQCGCLSFPFIGIPIFFTYFFKRQYDG